MNKILTTYASSGLPMTSGVLDFLQGAYSETIAGLAKAFIGPSYDPTKAYIINGLRATSTGGGTSFTEGLVLFNNEVFYSPAQSVAPFIAPNVLIANIQTTYPVTGEPLTYEDGSTHNTCQRRWVDMASGASGSGSIADYSSMRRVLQAPMGYDYANMSTEFPVSGGQSVGFFENSFNQFGVLGSGPEIGLNASMALDGCVVEFYVASTGTGIPITFVPDFGVTLIILSPLLTSSVEITTSSAGQLLIRMKFITLGGVPTVFVTTETP